MSNTAYRIVVSLTAVVIASYLLLSYAATKFELGPEGGLFLLTGEPRVIAAGDQLQLTLQDRSTSLAITFEEPIVGQILFGGNFSTPAYNLEWDTDNRRTVIATARQSTSTAPESGFIRVNIPTSQLLPTGRDYRKGLSVISIDGQRVTPYQFLSQFLDRENSNLELYYPLDTKNISSEIARRVGALLVDTILYSLLFLTGCQLLLLAVTVKQPDLVSKYFKDFRDSDAVTIVDRASRDFAVPIGLMGTISAIWVALEQPGTDFSSFDQILQVLRKAVFTTVLGITTRVLCTLRGLRFSPK